VRHDTYFNLIQHPTWDFEKPLFPIISSSGKTGHYYLPDPKPSPRGPPIKMTYNYWVSRFSGETPWSEQMMTYYEWSSRSTYPYRLKTVGWEDELQFPYKERFRWRGGIEHAGPSTYFNPVSRPVWE
jgi:hypothetical protein